MFQVQLEEPGKAYGMRTATGTEGGNKPPVPVKVGPQPPEEGVERKAPPAPVRRTPEQIAILVHDTGQAIVRLEKAISTGQPAPELVVQLKTELLNLLLAERLAFESEAARATLQALYDSRWHRHITRLETEKFGTVSAIRKAMTELVTARPEEFPALCRRIFEEVRNKFPLADLVCQPKGS